MTSDNYVVIGLAHVRSAWFTEVARWSTAGSIPVEFVKCLSPEELRARVMSGRKFSAALLDGRLPAVDRDALATLADRGIPSVVVKSPLDTSDWRSLGATATLDPDPSREDLLEVLLSHARPVDPVGGSLEQTGPRSLPPTWLGRLVAVTGHPGAGTSSIAVATAQAMAADPRHGNEVVLADLARTAHHALLHDARDVVPGIQELVEAHRNAHPTTGQVRDLLYSVAPRGYRLLLGLRRPSDWVTIRSQAFSSALASLRGAARLVVADIDSDLEGEEATGSTDIEDRNLMARTVTAQADLVMVVATPTTTGLSGLVHQLDALRSHGVPGSRLLAVINRAPRSARARAEITRAVAQLTGAASHPDPHVGPVFISERRHLDSLHRDLGRFPAALTTPLAQAVNAVLDRAGPRLDFTCDDSQPELVAPGSLGHWQFEEEAGS